jgi:hypothetical protein
MSGTNDAKADVEDAAVETGEGIRQTTEVAAADAEAGAGAPDGASPAASEEAKASEVGPEDDAWKKRRGGSTWGNWNSSKHTWRADTRDSSAQQAASYGRKASWKVEAKGAAVAGEAIRAYMREKMVSDQAGGVAMTIDLADFEETVVTMIGSLTESQQNEFAGV